MTTLLTLQEAADQLGVHYMTAYRYVRTGSLPATKQETQWRVRPADITAFAAGKRESAPAHQRGPRRRTNYAIRLVGPLLNGDEAASWTVVQGALASGVNLDELYRTVLGPAMVEIGDRWATGRATVAMEHSATAVMTRLIGRLGPQMRRRGRTKGTVVVGAPPGDTHSLPSSMFADLLRARGIAAIDLGADVPPESFAESVCNADRLLGVAVSVPVRDLAAVKGVVDAVREVSDTPIVLGAQGSSTRLACDVGATCHFSGALEAIDFFASSPSI